MNERVRIPAKKPDAKRENRAFQTQKIDFSRSKNPSVDRILFLQRTIGNQDVFRLIKSGALQAKLRIGQLGDEYEQEADRVAEELMRMHELTHVTQPDSNILKIQRRVASNYNIIKDNLSYGVLDWAITDEEVREVLRILNNLSPDDLQDTVRAMRGDKILGRLFDNVSDSDRSRFSDLLSKIRRIERYQSGMPDCCKQSLRTIDLMISSMELLRNTLGAAPFITIVAEHPADGALRALEMHWDLYIQAIRSIDSIKRNRVLAEIRHHWHNHINTPEERFWSKMDELWSE